MKVIPVLNSLVESAVGTEVTRSVRNFSFTVSENENVILENVTEGVQKSAVVIADESSKSFSVFLLT